MKKTPAFFAAAVFAFGFISAVCFSPAPHIANAAITTDTISLAASGVTLSGIGSNPWTDADITNFGNICASGNPLIIADGDTAGNTTIYLDTGSVKGELDAADKRITELTDLDLSAVTIYGGSRNSAGSFTYNTYITVIGGKLEGVHTSGVGTFNTTAGTTEKIFMKGGEVSSLVAGSESAVSGRDNTKAVQTINISGGTVNTLYLYSNQNFGTVRFEISGGKISSFYVGSNANSERINLDISGGVLAGKATFDKADRTYGKIVCSVSGGTFGGLVLGQGVDIENSNVTVTGGSIPGGFTGITAKNDSGTELARAAVTLGSAAGNINKKVDSIEITPGYTYGQTDIYTNNSSALGIFLPASYAVTGAATGESSFTGSVDSGAAGTLTVSVPDPIAVTSVTVSPDSASVAKGATQAFTAAVSGTGAFTNTVNWTVEGKNSVNTTISSAGVLTVGADETAATLTVRATSAQDALKSGTASVTVTGSGANNTDPLNTEPSNTGLIVGLSVGGFILLLIIAYCVLFALWHSQGKKPLSFLVPTFRPVNKLLFKDERNNKERKDAETKAE